MHIMSERSKYTVASLDLCRYITLSQSIATGQNHEAVNTRRTQHSGTEPMEMLARRDTAHAACAATAVNCKLKFEMRTCSISEQTAHKALYSTTKAHISRNFAVGVSDIFCRSVGLKRFVVYPGRTSCDQRKLHCLDYSVYASRAPLAKRDSCAVLCDPIP